MHLTDDQIDNIARSRGWVDYPSDSIEQGSVWHCEPDKAPFGKRWLKEDFRAHIRFLVNQLENFPQLIELVSTDQPDKTVEAPPLTWGYDND